MKLLLDQNLSPRLADRLADLFPDSSHVQRVGLDTATDDGRPHVSLGVGGAYIDG